MSDENEIIPIAIPLENYNLLVANLMEHLLLIDEKMNMGKNTDNQEGEA